MKKVAAWIVVFVGLAIAASPFISVARLQREVLAEVPLPAEATVVSEELFAGALFDGDFLLASRVVSAPADNVEAVLTDAGFEPNGRAFTGDRSFSRACCGAYDAVMVSVGATDSATSTLVYTVADSDVVYTWVWFTALGVLVVAGGLNALRSAKPPQQTATDTSPPADLVDLGSR